MSDVKIAATGSIFFTGWAILAFFIPAMSDRLGRRWIVLVSFITTVVCLMGSLFTSNLNMLYFFMLICGFTASGRIAVGFVYVCEFLTPTWRLIFITASHFGFVSTFILTVAYLKFVSNEY